jgi:hypothetical protein
LEQFPAETFWEFHHHPPLALHESVQELIAETLIRHSQIQQRLQVQGCSLQLPSFTSIIFRHITTSNPVSHSHLSPFLQLATATKSQVSLPTDQPPRIKHADKGQGDAIAALLHLLLILLLGFNSTPRMLAFQPKG